MLVNSIDISTYGATLLTREIQPSEVVIFDDWLSKSLTPIYLGKKVKYAKIKCQILIEGASDQECITKISNFSYQLSKCIIKFDDLDYYWGCTLTTKESTKLRDGIHAFVVEFKCNNSYLAEVTETFTEKNKTLNVSGNLETPAIVTITPSIGLGSVIISGFGKSITINNLTGGVPIIIDGVSCLVTANGINKFADTDMWSFPSLLSGANPISISQNGITCEVRYLPKFM